jgi:surfeit locus 1 family protein
MRRLKPWLLAIGALASFAATLALGSWQWGRAQQKLALHAAIEERSRQPPASVDELLGGAGTASLLHRQVDLRGEWLPAHTVYLDNRQMNGKPGFFVVTPLRLEGRPAVVAVQRGWVPRNFTDREQLPPVQTPPGVVAVRGRVAPPPARLYAFDSAERGRIRQNLDLTAFRSETGLPLLSVSVQQLGPASEGLLREWPEVASGADKNYGYAFQWWALSGLIASLYVWFQLIAPRRRARHFPAR